MEGTPITTPAARVIKAFSGVRETARILGISSSTVSRWQKPRDEGGTGGRIPTKHQTALLKEAQERGVELTPADLIE
jgi:transposase